MTPVLKPVLYADDDENDLFLMARAFNKIGITHPLQTVSDGKAAVAYLSGTPPYANREAYPLPCLLLLDLSLPGRHGLEVLTWLKNDPSHATMPVVVMTSSNQESDISRAYSLGADGFIIKPGDPDELLRIVKSLQQYWLSDKRPPGTFVEFAASRNIPRPKVDSQPRA